MTYVKICVYINMYACIFLKVSPVSKMIEYTQHLCRWALYTCYGLKI